MLLESCHIAPRTVYYVCCCCSFICIYKQWSNWFSKLTQIHFKGKNKLSHSGWFWIPLENLSLYQNSLSKTLEFPIIALMTTAQTSPKIMCYTRSCLIQIWRLKAECLWFKGKVVQTFLGQSKNACMKISQWLLFSYQLHLCMDDIRRCLSDSYYFLIMNPIQYIIGLITVWNKNLPSMNWLFTVLL